MFGFRFEVGFVFGFRFEVGVVFGFRLRLGLGTAGTVSRRRPGDGCRDVAGGEGGDPLEDVPALIDERDEGLAPEGGPRVLGFGFRV